MYFNTDSFLSYFKGKRSTDSEGNTAVSDTFLENEMLLSENKRLQQRIKAMQDTINALTEKNTDLLTDTAVALIQVDGESNYN